ncbi:MAG: hypothetical protein V4546_03940 [Bacteroidota bacterium]
MKPNQLFTSMLAVTALFVASCSAPRVAQNNAIQDDVYNTTAQAKEYKPAVSVQAPQVENTTADGEVDDYYGKSDPYYDMDYSSRIDRFYYGNMNRGYFDPFYNYYGYNSFYDPFWDGGFGLGFNRWGFNNWGFNNFGFNNFGFYGGWGYDPFWGFNSNFNRFGTGYWGGGFGGWGGGFGGGFYGGGNNVNANYRPRPDRGGENGYNRPRPGSVNGVPTRSNTYGTNGVTRSRAESYNPGTNGGTTARPNTTGSRPTRGEATARPTRSEAPPRQAPSYTPQRQSSPPPASSGGGGGSSRGGGSSSGGGGGGGRPGRG